MFGFAVLSASELWAKARRIRGEFVMTMEQGSARLREIAEQMKEDRGKGLAPSSPNPTVREFMTWFGYARRGLWFVERVREDLEANGLHTEPDFQHAYVDGPITFRDSTVSTPPPTVRCALIFSGLPITPPLA